VLQVFRFAGVLDKSLKCESTICREGCESPLIESVKFEMHDSTINRKAAVEMLPLAKLLVMSFQKSNPNPKP